MTEPTIPTFYQKSRIGRIAYQIRDHVLYISAFPERANSPRREYKLDLRRVDTNYTPKVTREYWLLIFPAITLLLFTAGIWFLRRQTLIPQYPLFYFYEVLAVGFVTSLVLAIRGSRRIEYYEFKDHWGKPLLNLVCEPEQRADCTAFIQELVVRADLARSDTPPEERVRLLALLDREPKPASTVEASLPRWSLAIVLGALAAGIPLLPGASLDVDPSIIVLIFPLCIGSLAGCYFSFQAKEPKRWWGVLGATLALLPPFFY